MRLQLKQYDIESRWQEDDSAFGTSPSKRWAVYTQLTIEKENASIIEKIQRRHKVGEIIALLIFSPAYKSEPVATMIVSN